MKKYIALTALLICTTTVIFGQPLNRPTYSMMIQTAEEQMEKKDYYRALEYYEMAYEESKDINLAILMADLNYRLRDYKDAEKWYSRALKPTKKNKRVEEWQDKRFEYARCLKMNEKYDQAIEEFDKFLKTATDPIRKELAEAEKVGCEMARVAKPVDGLTITNAGKEINTKNSEYSPFLTNDKKEMYFAAIASDDLIVVEEGDADFTTKIYKSTRGEKGWSKPTELDESVNRPEFFNVNVSLSPDGRRMYFNRSKIIGNTLSESKIYLSENGGGSWKPAQEVKGINGSYIAKSPAVGELFGNEVLFFASNMEGGHGGYDLYYATHKGNGVYGDPINLGPKINTIGDEDTPFYRDGVLYFSSTGHPGLGGYDIFMSTWNGTVWSKPQNMGKGYNSSVDDLYFMLDKEGYHGFLVSNRPAEGARSVKSKTCCNDIYNVSLKKIEASLEALTFDKETKEALPGVTIELIEIREDKTKTVATKTNATDHKFEFPLELDRAYLVVASADNYSNDTVRINTVGLFDSYTYKERLNLKPGRITKKIVRNEPFVLENIFYAFDDDKILPPAEGDLQVIYDLMMKYPDMVIELSSHTDSRGADEYNRQLSQRRAESARRWLTNKGIARSRIEAKGYGESQPKVVDDKTVKKYPFLKVGDVLTESHINALLPDTAKFEAAHQLNRRTEFKIIAGPTSITIEEEQLIQIGNRKVDGSQPQTNPKNETPKTQPDKNSPGNRRSQPQNRTSNRSTGKPGGDSIPPVLTGEKFSFSTDSIHPLSSLYKKKDLKGLPIMHFNERIHDMGKVKKGEIREHVFHYTNKGDVPLEIDIISVCECTTYEYAPAVVPPGGKGWIKVIFDSNKKDESDTSDVDIFLKNIDPEFDAPIFERVKYKFELVK